MGVRIVLPGLTLLGLGLAACKPLPVTEVPPEAAQQLLDAQTANQIQRLQTAAAMQAQTNNTPGFGGSVVWHATPPEQQLAAARSVLEAIQKDPSILNDPDKIKALAATDGFDAETLVMEWDNGKALDPKSGLLQNAQNLLRSGWAIQRVGYDPQKHTLLLYWVRLVRVLKVPGQ
jgi:hypothetical protein